STRLRWDNKSCAALQGMTVIHPVPGGSRASSCLVAGGTSCTHHRSLESCTMVRSGCYHLAASVTQLARGKGSQAKKT
uniref:Uncharacterized protein n=1 Tax=Strigops habroptila TaxID=2489341 RepID=A0A672UA57_STRHB